MPQNSPVLSNLYVLVQISATIVAMYNFFVIHIICIYIDLQMPVGHNLFILHS